MHTNSSTDLALVGAALVALACALAASAAPSTAFDQNPLEESEELLRPFGSELGAGSGGAATAAAEEAELDSDGSSADESEAEADADESENQLPLRASSVNQLESVFPAELAPGAEIAAHGTIENPRLSMEPRDMAAAAGYHHSHHHGHGPHGWLKMGAETGKKGAFKWHDKHPVGGKGR